MTPERERACPEPARARRAVKGAALTEMVVLMVVMVPLMFAMPMIGKLIDLRQTALQASRYATWEATVASGNTDRAPQVGARFFGEAAGSMSTRPAERSANLLWGGDPAAVGRAGTVPGSDLPYSWPGQAAVTIDDATVVTDAWSTGHGDLGLAGTVGDAVRSAGRALGGDRWDLADTSLTRAGVGVDVHRNGWFEEQGIGCGEGAGGCIREAGVILVDGWEADSDGAAADRVKALVPATYLESVGETLSILGNIPIFEELGGLDDMFGYVNMQPLPAHADRGLETYQRPE